MKQAGFTMVRMGDLSWDAFETIGEDSSSLPGLTGFWSR